MNTTPKNTRVQATNISLRYDDDERGKPADTDGQCFDSLSALERAYGIAPVDGRTATVTLSNGDTHELDADGTAWAVDGDTNRDYPTLAEAVDHLEVLANIEA